MCICLRACMTASSKQAGRANTTPLQAYHVFRISYRLHRPRNTQYASVASRQRRCSMKISRPLVMFGLFVLAHFLSYFFRSANAVISGDLTRELSLSAAQLGLMTSLFYASFALVQLPLGSALDRFGSRWVTPGLMLATAVGCLVFASARSFAVLALGRALIGVGMASVLMGAIKVYGQWFAANRVATISGFMVGLSSMGSLLAATPLAWLNQSYGWRAIFLWGAPVVVLSAGAIVAWVRNTPPGG